MTSLSLIRVIGITYSDMTAPTRVNKRWLTKIVSVATTIIALTLSLALVPLAPSFEDYIVQGIYYDEKNKLFVGFANKERHVQVLRAYSDQFLLLHDNSCILCDDHSADMEIFRPFKSRPKH